MFTFMIRVYNQRGALLVEALLIVTIIAVVLTYIVRSHATSLRALKYAQEYAVAVLLLENKMNKILKKGFIARDVIQEGFFEDPYDQFFYRLQVQKSDFIQGCDDLNQVSLSVFWPSGSNQRQIKAEMFLFNAF